MFLGGGQGEVHAENHSKIQNARCFVNTYTYIYICICRAYFVGIMHYKIHFVKNLKRPSLKMFQHSVLSDSRKSTFLWFFYWGGGGLQVATWVVPPPRIPVANEGLVRDPLLKT